MNRVIIAAIFILISNQVVHAIEPECIDWFKAGKISPNSKNCMTDCSSLGVDLGTFTCSMRCDELCHPQKDSCADLKTKIKKALKDGRPGAWERKTETARNWSESQKNLVTNALAKLPSRIVKLDGVSIYRMSKSIDKDNPASTLESSIVLYDEAFNGKTPLDQILAHELLIFITKQ
jgi:hypothetical protein